MQLRVHQLLGIQVSTLDGQMICRAALLLISVDLPAQSKVLNMKQYNGSYACNHCEDEGVPRPSSHLHGKKIGHTVILVSFEHIHQ